MCRRQHDVRVGSGRPEMHNEGSTLCRRDVRPNSTALFCTTARGIRAPSPIMQEFVWGICVEFRKTSTSTTKETSKSRKISVTEEPYHFRSRTEIISCREGQRSAAATRQRGWRVVGCAKIRPSWRSWGRLGPSPGRKARGKRKPRGRACFQVAQSTGYR